MGSTAKIIFSAVLGISVILVFLIFSMQKSAQLTLDVEDISRTVQLKDEMIHTMQQKLDAAEAATESAITQNNQIPKLQTSIAAIEAEKHTFQQKIEELQNMLAAESVKTATLSSELDLLQEGYKEEQQLLEEERKTKKTEEQLSIHRAKELQSMQELISQRDEEMGKMLVRLNQKDQNIKLYMEKIEAAAAEMSALQAARSSNQLNLELVLDELASKTKTITVLNDRIEQLSNSKISGKKVNAHPGRKNISSESAVDTLMKEINLASASPESDLLPSGMAELEELKRTNSSLRSTLGEQKALIVNLQRNLQTKEKELAVIQSQTEGAVGPLQERITVLEFQLEESKQIDSAVNDEVKALRNINVELKDLNNTLNSDLQSTQSALEENMQEVIRLTGNLEESGTTLQQKESDLLSLSKELETVKNDVSHNAEQYEQLESVLAESNKLSTEQAEQIKILQDKLTQQNVVADESEVLKKDINKLNGIIVEKEKSIEALTARLAENSTQLTTLQAALDRANVQRSNEQKDILEQEERTAGLLEEIAAAKALAEDQKTRLLSAEEQLAAFEEKAKILSDKEETIENLKNQLVENNAQLSQLQTEFDQVATQKDEEKKDTLAQEEKIAALLAEISVAKAFSEEQTEKLRLANEQLSASEEKGTKAAVLTEKVLTLETAFEDNQKEISELQAALQTITGERDQLLLKITDSDNDGVSDADDDCPNTVQGAQVNANGCEEDADNDGLVNRLDLCPDTVMGAAVNAAGCAKEQTTVVLEGIGFQTGTAELTEDAYPVADKVAAILQSNPELNMEIAGHTDSMGEPEANLQLSKLRAQAVMDYLVSRGVAEDQLKAQGYGAAEPIADNTTRTGRAQNRRVELRRVAVDEPQQEEEPVSTGAAE